MTKSYQEQRADNLTNVKKKVVIITSAIVAGVTSLALLMNSFTVIDETQEGVKTTWGKVEADKVYNAGVHWHSPIGTTIEKMPIGIRMLELSNVTMPTAAAPNQPVNLEHIVVRFGVQPGASASIRAKHGSIENFIHNQTRQDLLSKLRDKGRATKDTRTLLGGTTLADIQRELQEELHELAMPHGVNIYGVDIQGAVPHEREAQRMDATRDRQEQENTAASAAAVQETQDRMAVAAAEARRDAEAADNEAREAAAEADANAEISRATGRSEAAKLDADAEAYRNQQVAKSITPEIIMLEELKVRKAEAGQGWTGEYPQNMTIYGGDMSDGINFHKMLK